MAGVSLVTGCRGRLAFLRRSLPSWLGLPSVAEVIVVDSACPDGAADWADSLGEPRVRTVRLAASPHYRHAAVKNAGAAVARCPWLLFLDTDIVVSPGLDTVLRSTLPGTFARPDLLDEAMGGQILVQRSVFEKLGGYDEVYRAYSDEDIDLYRRLRFHGVTLRPFARALIHHQPHDPAARMIHTDETDLALSTTFNAAYGLAKIELMKILGTELDRAFRESLYEMIRTKLAEAHLTGTPQRIELALPHTDLPTARLGRTYVLTLGPPPR